MKNKRVPVAINGAYDLSMKDVWVQSIRIINTLGCGLTPLKECVIMVQQGYDLLPMNMRDHGVLIPGVPCDELPMKGASRV